MKILPKEKRFELKRSPTRLNQGQSMSAPEIPNLLSLRGRGRGRGRGRHGDPSDTSEDPEAAKAKKDKIVQQTDTDASISRLSAVAAGYLDDRFAQEFAPPGETQRRLPIINRGRLRKQLLPA